MYRLQLPSSSPTSAKFQECSLSWKPLTVWLPNGMNGHARRLKPIGRHVRVLLLNIRVVCSLANPLKKISLRQTRGDSIRQASSNIHILYVCPSAHLSSFKLTLIAIPSNVTRAQAIYPWCINGSMNDSDGPLIVSYRPGERFW